MKPPPKLLSGGNPQIPKGDGDGPVQDYIAAMPGWKQEIGRKVDHLVKEAFPEVKKAVKWNSPFYGREGDGWFLSFHCFDRYIKVAFLRGVHLEPMPPVSSKTKEARYLHVGEEGLLDDEQFRDWVRQASGMPGEKL